MTPVSLPEGYEIRPVRNVYRPHHEPVTEVCSHERQRRTTAHGITEKGSYSWDE